MTDTEATAYLTRYPDVAAVKGWNNLAGAKAHWAERGEREGRDKSVDSQLSAEEAVCYANRYDDLAEQRESGTNIAAAAQEHFTKSGEGEGRNKLCADRISKQ